MDSHYIHIYDHKGIRVFVGDETGNIVLGQSGIDILDTQNDLVTAGEPSGSTNLVSGADVDLTKVKQWCQITCLGATGGTGAELTIQLKQGSRKYTDIAIVLPPGTSIYGPFHLVKLTSTVTHNVALYLTRG